MNSSGTSHFVTIEPVSHIRRFKEQNTFWVPALYFPIHSMPVFHAFLSGLINWTARVSCKKAHLKGFALSFKEMSLLFGIQRPYSECGFVFFLIVCYFTFSPLSVSSSFCFLNLLLTKNRKVSASSLEAVSASVSHHLSVYLRLLCVKMFWQIIPISVNKVSMTE